LDYKNEAEFKEIIDLSTKSLIKYFPDLTILEESKFIKINNIRCLKTEATYSAKIKDLETTKLHCIYITIPRKGYFITINLIDLADDTNAEIYKKVIESLDIVK
jgi:hypothetical protein